MPLEPDISKTAGDGDSVPKYHQQKMTYDVSNGHMTDVVTWPWKVKLVTPIRLERNNVQKQQEMLFSKSLITRQSAVRQYGRLS